MVLFQLDHLFVSSRMNSDFFHIIFLSKVGKNQLNQMALGDFWLKNQQNYG